MSFENRGNNPAIGVPIYTVYSGEYQGTINHEFRQSHLQTPPPKYEDIFSGKWNTFWAIGESADQKLPSQLPRTYEGPEPAGLIFVAPVYKYARAQRTLGFVFTLLFFVAFIVILMKVLLVD